MLNDIIRMLEKARDAQKSAFIEVTIPGQADTEYIVNTHFSLSNKIEYYKKMYDENGVHKNCKDIRIVGAGIIESITCIERWSWQCKA